MYNLIKNTHEVKSMLFRRKTPRRCDHCLHATILDEDTVRCAKKGQRAASSKCLFFSYDPCKRIPVKGKALDAEKYAAYDYSL